MIKISYNYVWLTLLLLNKELTEINLNAWGLNEVLIES